MCPFLFFMTRLRSFYGLINILSIDIAAGAVLCALFFSSMLDVQIRIYGLLALALTVWIIYTADHLRDAKVIGANAASARHQFHFRHRKILLVCLVAAVIADAVVILFMRTAVFYFGIYLFFLVTLYLATQKYLKILKEVFIAVLYTCGIVLPSISVTTMQLEFAHYILFAQFAIAAWVNLLIFSWFDYDQDMLEQQHSFVTATGKQKTVRWLTMVSVLHLLFFLFQVWANELIWFSMVVVLMNALLIILFKTYREKDKELFRWAGDAVFFIPGLFWLWHQL
jgi:4-hydroxybenzoate polyprenyltransferase